MGSIICGAMHILHRYLPSQTFLPSANLQGIDGRSQMGSSFPKLCGNLVECSNENTGLNSVEHSAKLPSIFLRTAVNDPECGSCVEHSVQFFCAQCSTRWPSAQHFCSNIERNYQIYRALLVLSRSARATAACQPA